MQVDAINVKEICTKVASLSKMKIVVVVTNYNTQEILNFCVKFGRDEDKFIREIVKELRKMQNPGKLFHTKFPVGVKSRAEDIISVLNLNDHKFRIIAVLGISGSGKTTIVKAVYDRIAADFEYKCFIEDVSSYEDRWGQRWKFKLQKDVISGLTRKPESTTMGSHTNVATKIMKLIMGRKVLLVLDGVDKFEHLEALAINHASFSCLSRIIVTTTNKQSLVNLPCTPNDMRLLDTSESFELFAKHTFEKDDHVDEKFIEQVVWCAKGLPLVIDVWSRHFKCYQREYWPNILNKLKRIPHEDIQKKLQVSYDSLDNIVKRLFLDIACFFNGMDRDFVVKVLQDDDPGFFPEVEIQHLVNKGLVKIDTYMLSLHEVIKEMGQEVVRQENMDEPGERTRLMDDRDIVRVLEDCSGTELVESISWRPERFEVAEVTHLRVEALKKMRNLTLIELKGYNISWLCDNSSFNETSPLCFKKLKYMDSDYFPLKRLDTLDITNVVALTLWHTKLEILCEGMKSLKKLNTLDVSFSSSLTRTGVFPRLGNLEGLFLKDCDQLQELHDSISQLHVLKALVLDNCAKLELIPDLPPSIEFIYAHGCTRLLHLPHDISQLHKLSQLNLDDCVELESIPYLSPNIEVIYARSCTSLVNIFDSIGQLHKLKEINLDGCDKLESIPNLPPSIELVSVSDCTSLLNLPHNIGELHKLRQINLDGCAKLDSFPNLSPSIEVINACRCTRIVNLLDGIGELHKLREINLDECSKLESIPNLLPSIEVISMSDCTSLLNLPHNIGQLHKLRQINLYGHAMLETFPRLPSSIEVIKACHCTRLMNLLDGINGELHKLKEINLDGCSKLESIPNLPRSIEVICVRDCTSLVNLPSNMFELQNLKFFYLDCCFMLEPESLRKVSRMFKDLFITRGLCMSLSVAKLPIWCDFQNQNKRDVISIVAPMKLGKKISGVMIYLQNEGYETEVIFVAMSNTTKNSYHVLPLSSYTRGLVYVLFLPFGNSTLMVEAGDFVELHITIVGDNYPLSGGLSFINGDDDLLDYAALIQNAHN